MIHLYGSDTLNSPQGDGNTVENPFGAQLLALCQTPSIPRKGTETNELEFNQPR